MKAAIESFPRMTPRNLHEYHPLEKLHTDPHFLYITMHRGENHERFQSYYKIVDADMEQIIKDRPQE